MNPNRRYPDGMQTTFGGVKCGYSVITASQGASDFNDYMVTGDVIVVDLSSLSPIVGQHLEKEILKFSNGSKIVCDFEVIEVTAPIAAGGGTYGSLKIYLKIKRADGNYEVLATISPTSYGSPYGFRYWSAAYAINKGVRILVNNEYDYIVGQVVQPNDDAHSLQIRFFVPLSCTNSGFTQTQEVIISESNIMLRDGTDPYPNDYPSRWCYPEQDPVTTGNYFYAYSMTDLDTIAQKLSQGGDPIGADELGETGNPDDPVQEGDPSQPGGGGGGYDGTSDPIDFPILPTGGALSCGAVHAYLVDYAKINAVFLKLWDTSIFDISTFQKLVDNPMDCIISLHAIPFTPTVSGTSPHIMIGNFNTEIGADTISQQYYIVDCGSLNLAEFWGSALDYGPYTKVEIFLPFVGIKQLNVDDVMNKNIRIKYNIDILTGDCLAMIKCGTAVLYKYTGNLKQGIPVTGQNSDVQLKGFQATLSEIGGAAMGHAVGGPIGGAIMISAGVSAASSVAGSKIQTQRAGTIVGSVGQLDDFRPYLIIHRPIQSLANKFKTFKGYPSNITRLLSSVHGYTEVEYINLGGIPNATDAEMNEIKNLLQNGVLL